MAIYLPQVGMQAGRVAAARPASAGAAINFAEQCGSPHAAASFMRCIAAARMLPATSVCRATRQPTAQVGI